MKLLTKSRNGRPVYCEYLTKPYQWTAAPFDGNAFVALVVNADSAISAEDQFALSARLVEFGCRYAVCAGHNCSSWDDSIDWANIEADPELSDERFVMTTWHENQPIEEIANFFLNLTYFDNIFFHNFLILFIGEDRALMAEYAKACGDA